MKGTEMADFTQNPDPLLLNYVDKIIGGGIKTVYEAGFRGFEIQRSLKSLGIECVEPCRCLQQRKDRKRKGDKHDARKLSIENKKYKYPTINSTLM
jgi:transposase